MLQAYARIYPQPLLVWGLSDQRIAEPCFEQRKKSFSMYGVKSPRHAQYVDSSDGRYIYDLEMSDSFTL